MKFAKLLHNPEAGDGEHSVNELAAIVKAAGFKCTHDSIKEVDEEEISSDEIDFVVLAGGDGTVRKIAKHLLKENLPIALLPMGTANNIAKTLGLSDDTEEVVHSWSDAVTKGFDVGRVYGLGKRRFFLEGVGFGVFPRLMKEMRKQKKEMTNDPEKKLKTAVQLLHDIVQKYKARKCHIKIDGVDYRGKFLLAEVMNTRSIGPNLNLAPFADPGDGQFEVVLIPEERRNDFLKYLETKTQGNEEITYFHTIRASKVELFWSGRSMHIDDENVKMKKPLKVDIVLQSGALKFLVPSVQHAVVEN
jgi:diacylglycerol kinase family enzyme